MYTFRTLLLQLVFVVHFISFPTSNGGDTFQPTEKKVMTESDNNSKIASTSDKSTNQTDSLKIEEHSGINTSLFRRETPAKCLVQPSIISKENLPVKTNSLEKKNPPRKVSASNFIRIALAGDTQLF